MRTNTPPTLAHAGHVHRPLALAAALLVAGAAVIAHGNAHAQAPSQQLPLVPPPMPCTDCAAPTQPIEATPAPTASATPGQTLRLADVRFKGAQAVPDAELRTLAQPYIGRDVSVAELQTLAQAVTALYRQKGYFLAQALVPVQTVQDGVVEISVIEGRITSMDVNLAPEAPISEERVRGFLTPVAEGQAANAPDYERAMLLLSDQPGLHVGSTLQDGTTPGALALAVDVNPAPRWAFVAEADNHGTRESGRYRAGGTVRWNSPFGIGDNLDARLLLSNGGGMQFGRLSYEAPLGTTGWRLGTGLSRVRYELGGEFEALGAEGRADMFDLSLNYAVIRQRSQNLFLRLAAEDKRLTDEFEALNSRQRKRVRGLGLNWAWERRDDWLGGGYWASTGTLYLGHLTLRSTDARQYDELSGLNTAGSFGKLTARASRLQSLGGSHALYVSLGGQWANKNLDASEKLALGGPRAVRAYPSGEVLADHGLIGTVEWRWMLSNELTPFVFYDAARGRLMHDAPAAYTGDRNRSLRGMGLGLSWARPGNFSLNATLAWRAGTPRPATDGAKRGPRLYVHFQKNL